MEKVNLNYNNINFDEIVLKIKSSRIGKEIIDELQLTDEEIKNNYELLNNYIKLNNSCENCKSMNSCDHSTKGHRYGLKRDFDGDLTDYFTICKYYQKYYQKKKNIVFTTFNEEELLDSSQKTFLRDNYNLLGNFFEKLVRISENQPVTGAFIHLPDTKIRLKLIKGIAYTLLTTRKMAIVKFSDLLQVIKSEFKLKSDETTFKELLDCEILVIDGLGNESITNWSRDEILLSILDNRIQLDKTTILCSEYSIEQLKKIYKIGYSDAIKVEQLIEKIKELNN